MHFRADNFSSIALLSGAIGIAWGLLAKDWGIGLIGVAFVVISAASQAEWLETRRYH